jgi:hypothetical protein
MKKKGITLLFFSFALLIAWVLYSSQRARVEGMSTGPNTNGRLCPLGYSWERDADGKGLPGCVTDANAGKPNPDGLRCAKGLMWNGNGCIKQ